MVSGLKTAGTAMEAQSERLAVLANNLANVNTVGYKADQPEFFQLLTSPRAAGSVSPTGPAAPLPELPGEVQTRTDFTSGALRDTGNALDVAIEGGGFFVLETKAGPRLTRMGTFSRTADGVLATLDGTPVLGLGNRPVLIPETGRVRIEPNGAVSLDDQPAGQLLLVNPPLARLTKEGGTRFIVPADMRLTPAPDVVVRQGTLEQSNVNPITTLVEMIDALRVYETAQKSARSVDDTLGRAVNDVGRPS